MHINKTKRFYIPPHLIFVKSPITKKNTLRTFKNEKKNPIQKPQPLPDRKTSSSSSPRVVISYITASRDKRTTPRTFSHDNYNPRERSRILMCRRENSRAAFSPCCSSRASRFLTLAIARSIIYIYRYAQSCAWSRYRLHEITRAQGKPSFLLLLLLLLCTQ